MSTATVSRALNNTGHVAEKTRARIEAVVKELDHHPNYVARSLVKKSTQALAVLVPDVANPFFPELVKAVQLRADERKYTLLLCNTAGDPQKEREYLSVLRRNQVDGVLVAGLAMQQDDIRSFAEHIPIVSLDREINLPGAVSVQLDHYGGAQIATGHLLELGHRRIAHIAGPSDVAVSKERLAGYIDALTESGIGTDAQLLVRGDFSEDGGYRAMRKLLASGAKFTAIFAANDLTAIGAMAALRDGGVRVPEEVSVVGFDDIHLAQYTVPTLTTVRQPVHDIATRAVDLLIETILSGQSQVQLRRIRLDGELVARKSSAGLA